jgi:hypothetical protein
MRALLIVIFSAWILPVSALTLYSPDNQFQDAGTTWLGDWGQNRDNACQGNGYQIAYDKRMFKNPVRKRCANGNTIVRIDSYNLNRFRKPTPAGFCGPGTFSCGVGSNYQCCVLGESCTQPSPGVYVCK